MLWRRNFGSSRSSGCGSPVKNSDTDPADEAAAIAGGGAAWDDRRLSDNLNRVIEEVADEDRQSRRLALRRRVAAATVI
jgi:hypothetical protein